MKCSGRVLGREALYGWPGGGLHTKKNQTSIKIVEWQEEPNFYKNSGMQEEAHFSKNSAHSSHYAHVRVIDLVHLRRTSEY